jgi:hypothetical protein
LPVFSKDGESLYYLQRSEANRRFVSGELWAAAVGTGRRERLLPDFLTEHYSVSRDDRHVVFVSVDDDGRSTVWLATLDTSSPPRRLISLETVSRALFDPAGGVYFVGGSRGSPHLHHIKEDGTGLQRVVTQPIMFLYAVSPGGEALAVWDGAGAQLHSGDVAGVPRHLERERSEMSRSIRGTAAHARWIAAAVPPLEDRTGASRRRS